jgi:hypothetical protein
MTTTAAAGRALVPVIDVLECLVIIEVRALFFGVATDAGFGSHRGGFVRMLGSHAMAVLTLDVHEFRRGLLRDEPAGLPQPDYVAAEALRR